MINLIPNEEKKRMRRDFYYRLTVLFLLALGSSIFIGVAVMVPSYFVSKVKLNVAESKLAAQKIEPVPLPDQKTLVMIKDLDNKLTVVEKAEKNRFNVSEKIINSILVNKMPDIKIYEISYDNDSTKGKTVNIRGVAPSRDRLLLFRLALEGDPTWKSVNLPISNFIKGSNIQFSLSLIPS
ncbi:MAG: hypothetical protein KBD55_01315 [Candidatus Pacebacteria bacterium]|jgi:hypothetical protein|nr:hypothetical protein [Candidatus Paceibacterota bacterium]